MATAAKTRGNTNASGRRSTSIINTVSAAKVKRLYMTKPAAGRSKGKDDQTLVTAAATSVVRYHGQLQVKRAKVCIYVGVVTFTSDRLAMSPINNPTSPAPMPIPTT